MKPTGLMPAFRPSAPPRPGPRAAAIPGMLPRRGFEAVLDHYLELLSGAHMMVTLFAVDQPAPMVAEVETLITEALAPLGSVGRLPDGRVGLLYLGPGGGPGTGLDGEGATGPLHDYVRERIERRLAHGGWRRLAAAIQLAAVAGWSDGIREAADLIAALPQAESAPKGAEPLRRCWPGRS